MFYQSEWFWAGFIVLVFYSWQNFNKWTERETAGMPYSHTFKPRHHTVFPRFFFFSALYTALMELLYTVISSSPDILKQLGMSAAYLKNFEENRALASLLLITGISIKLPVLTDLELFLREKLHLKAFIPSEVRQIVSRITTQQNIYRPDEQTIPEVLQAMQDPRFTREDFTKPANRRITDDARYHEIRYKWCKVNYLKFKIDRWMGESRTKASLESCVPAHMVLQDGLAALEPDVRLLVDKRQRLKEVGADILEQRETTLHERLDDLLEKMYTFISCSVHASEKIPGKRSAAFKYFDVYLELVPPPKVDWDTVIRVGFLVFMLSLVTTAFYLYFEAEFHNGEIRSTAKALAWAIMSLLMNTAGIVVAVLLHRKIGDPIVAPQGYGPARRPEENLVQMLLAGVAGFLLGWSVPLFYAATGNSILDAMDKTWPWGFIPGVTAAFIIHHLNVSILGNNDGSPRERRLRQVKEAAIQGAMTAFTGAIVALVAHQNNGYFVAFSTITCGMIGAGIGFTFPEGYRKMIWRDRRVHERHDLVRDVKLQCGPRELNCRTTSLSLGAAGVDTVLANPATSQVLLDLPNVGPLPGTIVRNDSVRTYVRLHLNDAMQQKLQAFIASSH